MIRTFGLMVLAVVAVSCGDSQKRSSLSNAAVTENDLASPANGEDTSLKIQPRLDCVSYDKDEGHFTAHFGYLSNRDSEVALAIGEMNRFRGDTLDLGQPKTFAPGSTAQWPQSSFSVDFDEGDTIIWELDGSTVTAKSDSPRCLYSVRFDARWRVEDAEHLPAFPTELNDQFAVIASSDYGKAECRYDQNFNLKCEYFDEDDKSVSGLLVGADGVYEVSDNNAPEAWEAILGLGEEKIGDSCFLGTATNRATCAHMISYQLDAESAAIPATNSADIEEIVDGIKKSVSANSFWGGFAGAAAGAIGALIVYKLVTYLYYDRRYPYTEYPIPGGGVGSSGGINYGPQNPISNPPGTLIPGGNFVPGVDPSTPPSGGFYDPNNPYWGYNNSGSGTSSPSGNFQPGFDPYYPYGTVPPTGSTPPYQGYPGDTDPYNPNNWPVPGGGQLYPIYPAPGVN